MNQHEHDPCPDSSLLEEKLMDMVYGMVDACDDLLEEHSRLHGSACDCSLCHDVRRLSGMMEMFESLIESQIRPYRGMLVREGKSEDKIALIMAGWDRLRAEARAARSGAPQPIA